MTEETKFLKSKRLVKEGYTDFIINGDFGRLTLNELLKEYADQQLILSGVSQQRELLSDLIDFSNNNAPPIIQKGLKQVILEFNQSLNCG